MKSIIRVLIVASITLLVSEFSSAQSKATVHGQLVELGSYVREGIIPSSPGKRDIAMASLKSYGILALVENKTSKVFVLSPASGDTAFVANMTPYLGTTMFVKGSVKTRGGIRLLAVEDMGKSLAK
jgi:hypothetical protein